MDIYALNLLAVKLPLNVPFVIHAGPVPVADDADNVPTTLRKLPLPTKELVKGVCVYVRPFTFSAENVAPVFMVPLKLPVLNLPAAAIVPTDL